MWIHCNIEKIDVFNYLVKTSIFITESKKTCYIQYNWYLVKILTDVLCYTMLQLVTGNLFKSNCILANLIILLILGSSIKFRTKSDFISFISSSNLDIEFIYLSMQSGDNLNNWKHNDFNLL